MKRLHILIYLIGFNAVSNAQTPVNAFANITGIAGNVLTVNNVNESFHSFENGDYVIIMQMQDNVIGANTTNVATFGDLGSIQSAGLFEINRISSHTEASSLPTSITLSTALVNSYNINSNASVQIVTFHVLGTNFTSSGNIGTVAWNGIVGGVTAIWVTNVFTLNHNIVANGSGFAGGIKNTPNGYSGCDVSTYATTLGQRYAGKGEGIYKRTAAAFGGARGKILNAGGGGNDVNGGGGGGGNYSSGGGGGSGWVPSGVGCSPVAGGIGGLSLSGSISGNRIFMGGGGGGGHENDGVGTVGGAGGGIIIVKAGTLVTSSCSGVNISANGIAPAAAANDGAGGAGAGGSVIFNVDVFSISGGCPLTVNANGGNGGNSNASSSGAHGGGGGGGQGVVIYPAAQPVTNITTNTIPGTGGVSCSGCNASQNAVAGTGPPNAGIIVNATGPLPIELVSFDAAVTSSREVRLNWTTAVEKNAKGFIIQRMNESGVISDLGFVPSKGNFSEYNYLDPSPWDGINYYRLKQIDLDGKEYLKLWRAVDLATVESEIVFYPNPVQAGHDLMFAYEKHEKIGIEVIDLEGKVLTNKVYALTENTYAISTAAMSPGLYILKITAGNSSYYKKLVISEQ